MSHGGWNWLPFRKWKGMPVLLGPFTNLTLLSPALNLGTTMQRSRHSENFCLLGAAAMPGTLKSQQRGGARVVLVASLGGSVWRFWSLRQRSPCPCWLPNLCLHQPHEQHKQSHFPALVPNILTSSHFQLLVWSVYSQIPSSGRLDLTCTSSHLFPVMS